MKATGTKPDDVAPTSVCLTNRFAVLGVPGEKDHTTTTVLKETGAGASTSAGGAGGGTQGRRAKAGSGPKMTTESIGGDSFVQRTPNPSWLQQRVSSYDTIKARREMELAQKQPVTITIAMPDGKQLTSDAHGQPFMAWKTTPYDVAVTISQGLADSTTVARVTYESFVSDYSLHEDGMDGADMVGEAMAESGVIDTTATNGNSNNTIVLWDMMRPLVGSVAKLEFLKFEQDTDAKTVFWHSSAHMMGEALEHLFGSKLTIGPPLAGGFYYDSYMGTDALREDDCK
jgi:threonyl-tRNA synthetase